MSARTRPDTAGYPEPVSTNADTEAPARRTAKSWFWPAFIMLQVIQYLVSRLTGWPWWVLSAPVAAIAVVVIAYAWAKNRRREAQVPGV